jgi:putative ABC transport system permease protein
MKYLHYILRNARRNPVRSFLTVASISICLFLMMMLISFLSINDEAAESLRIYNRIVTMSSQGFAQPVPIARVNEIGAMDGVACASPFAWFGGKYNEQTMPFAQFAVDPDKIFAIYDELTIPPDQLKEFQKDKAGCVIGTKLAEDYGLKIGDRIPLKGDTYPFDLNLTIRGIYDGPHNRDRRMCMFHYPYLDDGLKKAYPGLSGNAGIVVAKCKNADMMPAICRKIDEGYKNSDTPTRSQTEEAFGKMFAEYFGNMRDLIQAVGIAVVASLVCVAGNSMAMSMRERTTEVAVLKAIGFRRRLVMFLVLAEAIVVAGLGGVLGALGAKFLFDAYDVAKHTGGFLPFFYIPWPTALLGLGLSLLIGLASGIIPATRAAMIPVVDGLRKVV